MYPSTRADEDLGWDYGSEPTDHPTDMIVRAAPDRVASWLLDFHANPKPWSTVDSDATHKLLSDIAGRYNDLPVHVVTYKRDQAYGGPEEGGWWFTVLFDPEIETIAGDDMGEILRTAFARAETLRDEYAESFPREEFVVQVEVCEREYAGFEQNRPRPIYC